MTIKEMENEVLQRVSIPDYIYEIVLPNMSDYYNDEYEVNFDNSRYMKCCFHSEDTPSLRWYEETNTYYCFGCGKGGRGPMGTVIGFHMNFAERINGKRATRSEAIVFLYKYFIQEKDIRSTFSQPIEKKEKNNSVELAVFNLLKNDVEKSITSDDTIDMSKKVKIYDILDNLDMLLTRDLIEVAEARKKIEQIVSSL